MQRQRGVRNAGLPMRSQERNWHCSCARCGLELAVNLAHGAPDAYGCMYTRTCEHHESASTARRETPAEKRPQRNARPSREKVAVLVRTPTSRRPRPAEKTPAEKRPQGNARETAALAPLLDLEDLDLKVEPAVRRDACGGTKEMVSLHLVYHRPKRCRVRWMRYGGSSLWWSTGQP